ncbi:MAG: hypothetical protein LBT05_02600 [Planctomycetaceae bacterium]|jgi:hypothetical protein|nr:hypothetical protein [Planctomycetaceae bacterium]
MALDVYKEWLGIDAAERPLNHYQLLKLALFEDNTLLIRKRYRTLNAHIRKYATGDFIDESQMLLNELAQAMLCLTDAERKTDYDVSLGRTTENIRQRKTFEDILLAGKVCTPEQIKKAKAYADAVGLDTYQAALQHKLAPPETIMLAYAESIGLPFISLDEIGVDAEYAPQIPPAMARQHSFVPVMVTDGKLLLASPTPVSPDVEQELRMLFEIPVRSVICAPTQVNDAIAKYYPKDAKQLFAKKNDADAAAKSVEELFEQAAIDRKANRSQAKKEREEQAAPISEDAAKQRLQYTIVAFNFGVMAIAGLLYSDLLIKNPSLPLLIAGGLLGGALAGGTTYFAASKR